MSVALLVSARANSARFFDVIADGAALLASVRDSLRNAGAHISADVLLPDRYHALLELPTASGLSFENALVPLLAVRCSARLLPPDQVFAAKAFVFTEPVRQRCVAQLIEWPLGTFRQWLRWGGDRIAESGLWDAAAGFERVI